MATTPIDKVKSEKTLWESQSPRAFRELAIKKIAIGILASINLAGIAAGLIYVSLFYPIPTQALIISPFIVGVLISLAYMKASTCGISRKNYQDYLNPAVMFARIVTTVLYGPVMLLTSWIDWTPYHDPYTAHEISGELKGPWDEVLDKYGHRIKNLTRYGYITKEEGEEFKALYSEFIPLKRKIEFHTPLKSAAKIDSIEKAKTDLKARWDTLKNKFILPDPKLPDPDFSKLSNRLKTYIRQFFCHAPVF